MKIEGQVRIPSGCAIAAVISQHGNKMSGEMITNSMKPMHDRSNGLGGGFAGYGIYLEYKDFYALHLFFDTRSTRKDCEAFFKERFEIIQDSRRMLVCFTDWKITKAIPGQHTDVIQQIYKQANSGGVLLSSMGNPPPFPVYWDKILINASQVTLEMYLVPE